MAFLSTRALLVLGVCTAVTLQCAAAATYNVGGASRWIIPSGNKLYETWASNKTFKVGDSLVFNFTTNAHNVLEVTKANYDSCTVASPVQTYTTGPAVVNLSKAGAQYYICGITGHCAAGQKLTITVTAAVSPTPSPTPSTSPLSPPSLPSPTPSPSSSSPPSTSSPPAPAKSPAATPSTTPSPSSTTTPSPPGTTKPSPAATPSGTPSSNASYRSISSLTVWMGMLSGVAAVFFVL